MKIYSDFSNNFEKTKFPFLSNAYSSSRNYIQSSNSLFYDFKIPTQYQLFSPYNFALDFNHSLFNAQFIGIFQMNPTSKPSYLDIQRGFASLYDRRYIEFVLIKNYWGSEAGCLDRIVKTGLFFRSFNFIKYCVGECRLTGKVSDAVQNFGLSPSTPSWISRNKHKNLKKFKWPFFKAFGFVLDARRIKKYWPQSQYKFRKPLLIHGFSGLYKTAYWLPRIDQTLLNFSDFKGYFKNFNLPKVKIFESGDKGRFKKNKFTKFFKLFYSNKYRILTKVLPNQLYTRPLREEYIKILVFKFYFKYFRFFDSFEFYINRLNKRSFSLETLYKVNPMFFRIFIKILSKFQKKFSNDLSSGLFFTRLNTRRFVENSLKSFEKMNHLIFQKLRLWDIKMSLITCVKEFYSLMFFKNFIDKRGQVVFNLSIDERFETISIFPFLKAYSNSASSTFLRTFPCGFRSYTMLNQPLFSYAITFLKNILIYFLRYFYK